MIKEEIFLSESVSVKYRFKLATSDRQHLLIIFSDFGWPEMITYNFSENLLKGNEVDVSSLKNNRYEVYVSMAYKRSLFTIKVDSDLLIYGS